jgi:phage internal scaffolding protein
MPTKTKVKNIYSASERVALRCGPGRTKQAFKEECDINNILNRYQRTGNIEHRARWEPVYMAIDPIDFQTAMDTVATAKTMFEELPSDLRKKFGNSPGAFLSFVQDPGNLEEMIQLGLASPDRRASADLEPDGPGEAVPEAVGGEGSPPPPE